MHIVVDRNIRAAPATFGAHARLSFLDGRDIRRQDLVSADALLVRTATRVDAELLEGTPVRFVGSTSIGTDHMDTAWLDSAGIRWANAPGCNADAAAQYTLAMAWLASARLGRNLQELSVGIVGRGNVGSRVMALFEALGMDVVANDPPLAEAGVQRLVSLDAVLERDLVCLHTPLTRLGPHPTWRLFNASVLGAMNDGALLLNAGRGDVVDGDALRRELGAGRLAAALDVWPGEPRIDAEILRASTVATPHVAGYSDDGKRRGTLMVYRAFCEWAGLAPVEPPGPPWSPAPLRVSAGREGLGQALEAACFVSRHDAGLRALAALSMDERALGFDRLRRDYPPRRDFQAWTIECPDLESEQLCHNVGFAAVPVA